MPDPALIWRSIMGTAGWYVRTTATVAAPLLTNMHRGTLACMLRGTKGSLEHLADVAVHGTSFSL